VKEVRTNPIDDVQVLIGESQSPAASRHRLRLAIGGRDREAGAVSARLHHGGPQGAKPKVEVVADILASIKDAKSVIAFLILE
jgi:hypothetical protein